MDLRTHVWGITLTGLLLLVAAAAGVAWVRPLPSRADERLAEIEAAWAGHVAGEVSDAEAVELLADMADAGPGFGESLAIDETGNDAYDRVHREAVSRLGMLDHPSAMAALGELAVSDDRQVCLYAVEALRRQKKAAALPALFAALEHDDDVQRRVGTHFARVTQEALRAIRDVADADTLARLRRFAESARRSFDTDIRRTINLIADDLANPDVIARDTGLRDIDQLLNPQADRLDVPSHLTTQSLTQPTPGTPMLPGSLPDPSTDID